MLVRKYMYVPSTMFIAESLVSPKEKMLLSNQMKDVESWAGKGNVSEANLDFIQKALAMDARWKTL